MRKSDSGQAGSGSRLARNPARRGITGQNAVGMTTQAGLRRLKRELHGWNQRHSPGVYGEGDIIPSHLRHRLSVAAGVMFSSKSEGYMLSFLLTIGI